MHVSHRSVLEFSSNQNNYTETPESKYGVTSRKKRERLPRLVRSEPKSKNHNRTNSSIVSRNSSTLQHVESAARNRHHKSGRKVTYDDDGYNDQGDGESLIDKSETKSVDEDSDQESHDSSAGRSYSSYESSVTDYQFLLHDITICL